MMRTSNEKFFFQNLFNKYNIATRNVLISIAKFLLLNFADFFYLLFYLFFLDIIQSCDVHYRGGPGPPGGPVPGPPGGRRQADLQVPLHLHPGPNHLGGQQLYPLGQCALTPDILPQLCHSKFRHFVDTVGMLRK